MTTILLKRSNTPGAIPGTANLTNSTGGAEVAVNTADKRMFTITSGSAIVELGTNPSTLTLSSALAVSSGGTGTSLTPTNGQLLIGNGTGYALSALTAGTNISVTNGAGSIAIGFTGTLPVASGGTGQTSYTNGQLLIGNTTGNTLTKATLTAGSNIAVTNGTGSITIGFTGTLPVASGGTGSSSTPTNGQVLIGNGTGYTLSTLTAGSNITITSGTGSITIASSGAGDVVGPASATDDAAVRFDSTTGKLIQNSALTINDSGNITTAGDALINNVYIGRRTSVTGGGADQNLVIGQSAAISLFSLGSQNLNTIVGNNAGNGLTGSGGTGNFNTMFGYGAGGNGGNNSSNTYIGYVAGSNINAASNVAVGHAAMQGGGGSTASQNVAVGFQAMYLTTGGGSNTAVGYQAGDALTSSNWNTLIGHSAGTTLTSGPANTFIGYFAGGGVTTGNSNTALGDTAYLTGNYSNSTCLGAGTEVTGSNQVQLGSSSTTTYAYGAVQDRSDARDKADIQETNLGMNFIMQLQPRMFRWDMREDYRPPKPGVDATEEDWAVYSEACKLENLTHDGTKKRNRFHQGLIAQEVKSVMDSMGLDFGGYQDHKVNGGQDVLTIGYEELIPPLIKAIQELKAEFDAYKATHP